MKRSPDKQLYNRLRLRSCDQLWDEDVPQFDRLPPEQRVHHVALIRAVGVVLPESGSEAQKDIARLWLRGLLRDPAEKVRRYAMAAIPKIGAGPAEEAELLSLFRSTPVDRERKFLAQTLEKIGGTATLQLLQEEQSGRLTQAEQKVKASLARRFTPSTVRFDAILSQFTGLKIHLRGRRGLDPIVRAEIEDAARTHAKFRLADPGSRLVTMRPVAPFSLADIYRFRCFGTAGILLGAVGPSAHPAFIESLASVITSPLARRILETLTDGPIRYRLEFVSKGHQRGAVRLLANRVYSLCSDILNDARAALWVIEIHPDGKRHSVELRPNFPADPRFYYRRHDVPAASHPPLAACMARLAGRVENDVVWDPFCGSGLELIERAILGGVRTLHGTDRNPGAIAIARDNFAAASIASVEAHFTCIDFRSFDTIEGLGPQSATLIITNPPLGKRVPVPDLRALIADLFHAAATVLKPGGRLVFVNPLRMETSERTLKLEFRQVIDLGGFDCRLEKYLCVGEPASLTSFSGNRRALIRAV
jgi:predicted RNA methylase